MAFNNATIPSPVGMAIDDRGRIFVICCDGSFWQLIIERDDSLRWEELNPIPGSLSDRRKDDAH